MSFKLADISMTDSLLRIWLSAFPEDSKEDIRLFFSKFLKPDYCAIWMENGAPVSMTFMLPAELIVNGRASLKLAYIYAAATLTEYRGRGIFGRLLNEAHRYLKAKGTDACFLHPADGGLYRYYSRFGYKNYFQVCTETFDSGSLQSCQPEGAPEETGRLNPETRNSLLSGYPVWVKWPEQLILLAASGAERMGGSVIEVKGGWAVCEPSDGGLYIPEWLCLPEYEDLLLKSVVSRFPDRSIVLRRPVHINRDDRGEKFGMICPLTPGADKLVRDTAGYSPYMGFTFD
ncbi:MAG TPA: GNAT family N-acetyltransferase [Candidatus Avimonas sp.]|jgi:GNAT superfamily N-acetyltransferase|nr:GNAT family N-acetyltransferase [Clostridiales bacterium]HOB36752.1 GNAT family N-acetyltransferase [Candidatus Avimonas sp.]HQA16229.1 GNAT family N-acetyltransferase [Candidatus Avimonas sp.]HQD38276.1 GNAT family N-acetyltransferase [Candidatus Avimonas sp.]